MLAPGRFFVRSSLPAVSTYCVREGDRPSTRLNRASLDLNLGRSCPFDGVTPIDERLAQRPVAFSDDPDLEFAVSLPDRCHFAHLRGWIWTTFGQASEVSR